MTEDYVGCSLDLCPKGMERLCCFDCTKFGATCSCDEAHPLQKDGQTKFACEWYQSSTPTTIKEVKT